MGKKWGKLPATLRIRISADEAARLRERAARRKSTVAATVRDAINDYLQDGDDVSAGTGHATNGGAA